MRLTLTVSLALLVACANPSDGVDPTEQDTGVPPITDDCVASDEVCDGVDNDCDGSVDEEPLDGVIAAPDLDGDGFGDSTASVVVCTVPEDFVDNADDCDDADAAVHPDALEVCDGVDNDCSAETSEIGLARLQTEEGVTDLTAALAGTAEAPASLVMEAPGTLELCDGTYFVHLDVRAELAIVGQGPDRTFLDGTEAGTVLRYENGGTHALSDLAIQNGFGGDAKNDCNAGGICVSGGAELTGENLVLRDNVSTTEGGALAMNGGVVTFLDVDLTGNTATEQGGAIRIRPNGQLTMIGGSLTFNEADRGGAFYQLGGRSATVFEDVVIENNAAREGGGLVHDNGDLTLRGSRVVANTAETQGGGIHKFADEPLVLEDTVLADNTAARGAALMSTGSAQTTTMTCTASGGIFGNTSTNDGNGAVDMDSGTFVVSGCDFVDPVSGAGNSPADVRAGGQQFSLGAGSFMCDGSGCAEVQTLN